MGDEKLFRVGPGSGEWICYDALLDELWKWSSRPAGTGLPAITISKRDEEPADAEIDDDGAHTPAVELRQAASLLREAASHATKGPWRTHDTWIDHGGHTATVLTDRESINDTELVAWLPTMSNQPWDETRNAWRNAGWMALMHPGAGVALADWLDAAAENLPGPAHPTHVVHALVVARQVLGAAGEQPTAAECACGILRAGPGRHLPECPDKPDTDRPGAETGFVCKCPQGCCGHGQQKAVAALCGCDPAPHREEDGTYSHYAGCPVADAQQKFGHHVD